MAIKKLGNENHSHDCLPYNFRELTLQELLSKYFCELKKCSDELTELKADYEQMTGTGERIVNIKEYGAKGDGLTDDTVSFLNAIKDLQDGDTLLIPNGEYIVYKDFNGVDNYLINKITPICLKGLKNISIVGEGNATIRPNNQGVSEKLLFYPSTISIDLCENILIKNLTIESKGQSYGNADYGHNLPRGEERVDFIIKNGGHAIFVGRSKNVDINGVKTRLCGSCGVIYHSNVSDCIVQNTFSNPNSLGYGAYCTDTFSLNDGDEFNNKIKYINCNSWSETLIRDNKDITNPWCSKSGIVLEGDQRALDVEIINCIIKDCYANSIDEYLGSGVISYNSKTKIINTHFENVARMVFKRDELTSEGNLKVLNCSGVGLRTNGITIKDLYSLTDLGDIIIDNNYIHVDGTVVYPDNVNPYLRVASGIVNAEYRNNSRVIVSNNIIISPNHAIHSTGRCVFNINTNELKALGKVVCLDGGGIVDINNNVIKSLGNDNIVELNTQAFDGIIMALNGSITNNTIIGNSLVQQAISILTTNTNIVSEKVKNNSFLNCCLNVDKTNFKPNMEIGRYRLVSCNQLLGSYTILEFDFSENIGCEENKRIIIKDDGNIAICEKGGRSVDTGQYLEIFYAPGDVRSQFTVGQFYTIM